MVRAYSAVLQDCVAFSDHKLLQNVSIFYDFITTIHKIPAAQCTDNGSRVIELLSKDRIDLTFQSFSKNFAFSRMFFHI